MVGVYIVLHHSILFWLVGSLCVQSRHCPKWICLFLSSADVSLFGSLMAEVVFSTKCYTFYFNLILFISVYFMYFSYLFHFCLPCQTRYLYMTFHRCYIHWAYIAAFSCFLCICHVIFLSDPGICRCSDKCLFDRFSAPCSEPGQAEEA